MKRKIAAILVAHVADYGRLIADDEEETLRRVASCRSATDELIALAGGRIFNSSGDAVLAEFPSAVEATRCAIDIQESLRTRNLAYPASRQICFRIGIGVGDVVERDDDLLGDGINVAARLEGLAEAGGICISRTVHEQVSGKLTARFIDIGAQKVKNIPEPVHAYIVAAREPGRSHVPAQASAAPPRAKSSVPWLSRTIGVAALCAAAVAFFYSSRTAPDGEPALNRTTAAALPPVPVTPSPSPHAPAIRRTSAATSEPKATKRSFQFCNDLALERGWRSIDGDIKGKPAFIAACMNGDLN
jgi:class 3 adenylate cyclase